MNSINLLIKGDTSIHYIPKKKYMKTRKKRNIFKLIDTFLLSPFSEAHVMHP